MKLFVLLLVYNKRKENATIYSLKNEISKKSCRKGVCYLMNEKECDKRIFQNRFISITLGETQEEISRKINTTRQNVGKLLSGQTLPNALLLKSICKAYGVSADYLLGFTKTITQNEDISAFVKYTGLSENTVEILALNSDLFCTIINKLIDCEGNFEPLLETLYDLQTVGEMLLHNYKDKDGFNLSVDFDEIDTQRYKAHRIFDLILNFFDIRENPDKQKEINEIKQSIKAFKNEQYNFNRKKNPPSSEPTEPDGNHN